MKSNILGDIRAENDSLMLDKAFFETADYKTLVDSSDRCVVVGRRGTGKSALVHRLNSHWRKEQHTFVVTITPEEDQIIGLRGILKVFGDNFIHIKAGSKIAWRYAMYMEILSRLNSHYKMQKLISRSKLSSHLNGWGSDKKNCSLKLRNKLKTVIDEKDSSENNIADLASKLKLDEVEIELNNIFDESKHKFIVLVDRLDEGYTPDNLGVAIVDGFVQAVIEINSKVFENVRSLVFLRDNMYRSITINDPDFTRNIEGQVLRLHWDDYGLFNLICNRIRVAFENEQENSTRLWNTYAARDMRGREGFKIALRLTLYRPRDILVLLNNAFFHAASENRNEIIIDDIDSSAKSISNNRLIDLHKEYEIIFPALNYFTSSFTNSSPEINVSDACSVIDLIISKDDHEATIQRDLSFFENSIQVLQRLYGIGFLGIYDESATSFVFSHDGRDPSKEISHDSKLLIHPCYWLALNLTEKTLGIEQAEEIYDEYDIEISSITDEQRKARIGRLLEEFKTIKLGIEDCHAFENWCLKTIKLIFAGSLSNVELHPNKNNKQQRDIVCTNMSGNKLWERIYQDYAARQVIFEIKNYDEFHGNEYRQMNTYLTKGYGKLGFIISRCDNNNLQKGKDLAWAQEIYFEHEKIIIKLSANYLMKHLSKLRNPQKHDSANIELSKLLDTYIRQYLSIKCK